VFPLFARASTAAQPPPFLQHGFHDFARGRFQSRQMNAGEFVDRKGRPDL